MYGLELSGETEAAEQGRASNLRKYLTALLGLDPANLEALTRGKGSSSRPTRRTSPTRPCATMKIRRKIIEEHFKDLLDGLYDDE